MIPVRSFVVGLLGCLVIPLAVASGQRLKPSLDLSAEGWGGRAQGQVFSHSNGFAGAALSSWRVRSFSHGAVIAGAAIGAHHVITCCADRCALNPGTPGCAPDYPAFSLLAGHVGLERTLGGVTGRVIGGPAVFHSQSGTAAGLQTRADLATPPAAHVSFVLSWRGARLPRFQGRRYEMQAVGIGIRVGD